VPVSAVARGELWQGRPSSGHVPEGIAWQQNCLCTPRGAFRTIASFHTDCELGPTNSCPLKMQPKSGRAEEPETFPRPFTQPAKSIELRARTQIVVLPHRTKTPERRREGLAGAMQELGPALGRKRHWWLAYCQLPSQQGSQSGARYHLVETQGFVVCCTRKETRATPSLVRTVVMNGQVILPNDDGCIAVGTELIAILPSICTEQDSSGKEFNPEHCPIIDKSCLHLLSLFLLKG